MEVVRLQFVILTIGVVQQIAKLCISVHRFQQHIPLVWRKMTDGEPSWFLDLSDDALAMDHHFPTIMAQHGGIRNRPCTDQIPNARTSMIILENDLFSRG